MSKDKYKIKHLFFIVKTRTGDYYTGLVHRSFNDLSIDLEDVDRVKINNIQIPISNIDYVKLDISYREWLETCEELGITDNADYKKALRDYYLAEDYDVKLIRLLMYMIDLY